MKYALISSSVPLCIGPPEYRTRNVPSPGEHVVSEDVPLNRSWASHHAAAIFQAAKHPWSYVSLDDANHLLSRDEDTPYTADVPAAWASRCVTSPDP